MKPKLHIIICSTRPGRVGPSIAQWFSEFTAEHGKFDAGPGRSGRVQPADLRRASSIRRRRTTENAHTKAWAESVRSADAFVFVTPEYNFAPPPVPHQRAELSVAGVELYARRLRELWRHLGRPARRPDGEADRDDAQDDADSGRRADADGLPRTWTRTATSSPSNLQDLGNDDARRAPRWAEALKSLRAQRKAPLKAAA